MDNFYKTIYYAKEWCRPKHPPINTLFIVMLCSIVYIGDMNVSLITPPSKSEPWWTYPASSVSHWSNEHFLTNMLSIIGFGSLLEIVHGSFASFTIFWYSCLSGALWHVALQNGNTSYRGASAGFYGFIGSYLAHIIINWKEAPFKCIWIILLILESITVTYFYINSDRYRLTVAHWAHAFGFIQGTLLSIIVLRNMIVKRWELCAQVVSFFISSALIIVCLNIIYT